jgi:transcriptional regulator with XRE-family HTH domain
MQIFPNIDKSKLDNFYKNIGVNVKKYRIKKNISQLELAISIGHKSTSFLSNCENYKNKEHFNLEHLYLIADVLDVDICNLIKSEVDNG